MDSAFETACRAYLKYIVRIKLDEAHKQRKNLVKVVKYKLTSIDKAVWKKIDYYYEEIRNDLYHQTSSLTIPDNQLHEYVKMVKLFIDTAFSIKCDKIVASRTRSFNTEKGSNKSQTNIPQASLLLSLPKKKDKMVLAVAHLQPRSVNEVNVFFKTQGDRTKITATEFTSILGRNKGSMKYFFFDKVTKSWHLSEPGKRKLEQFE